MRVRVVVSGKVQGVFYRASCEQQANAAGVRGWVANRDDGTVEAVLEGERDAVDSVLAWMREGPAHAVVSGVEVTDEEPQGDQGFHIR